MIFLWVSSFFSTMKVRVFPNQYVFFCKCNLIRKNERVKRFLWMQLHNCACCKLLSIILRKYEVHDVNPNSSFIHNNIISFFKSRGIIIVKYYMYYFEYNTMDCRKFIILFTRMHWWWNIRSYPFSYFCYVLFCY